MLGFPTLIAIHSVGMAVAVGISVMVAVNLNSQVINIPPHQLHRLLGIAAWGFIINFITGVALFTSRATAYIVDPTFLIKLFLVLLSAGILFWLKLRLKIPERLSKLTEDRVAKNIAFCSIFTWTAAVVTGRLIAYLSGMY
jgi:hypothetical protein